MRDYNFKIDFNDPLFSKRKPKLLRRILLISSLLFVCGGVYYGVVAAFNHATATATNSAIDSAAIITNDLPNIAEVSSGELSDETITASPDDILSPKFAPPIYLELIPAPVQDESTKSSSSVSLPIDIFPALAMESEWLDFIFADSIVTTDIVETEPALVPFVVINSLDASLPSPEVRTIVIKSGDTLSSIFQQEKLPNAELRSILKTKHASHLKTIKPGQKLELTLLPKTSENELNTLQQLSIQIDTERHLAIKVDAAGHFSSHLDELQLVRATQSRQGTVDSSLLASMNNSGVPHKLAVEMSKIFESSLDFNKDVRKGDRYALVYETFSLDGKLIRTGNILAAEYTNRGRIHRAVRYTDADGGTNYYTPEGNSLKQAFARYPLKFTRISSRFSKARKHPILGIRRPHLGVDFAAPAGTPIIAAGDGRVAHIGTKGGYGRAIIIQHNNRYTTLYAHMSHYAKGLKQGDKVRHGQVIGYVGSTGASTGPHLHYEFHANGVHQDPLDVKLPTSISIEKAQLAVFHKETKTLLAMLDDKQKTVLASSKSTGSNGTSKQ